MNPFNFGFYFVFVLVAISSVSASPACSTYKNATTCYTARYVGFSAAQISSQCYINSTLGNTIVPTLFPSSAAIDGSTAFNSDSFAQGSGYIYNIQMNPYSGVLASTTYNFYVLMGSGTAFTQVSAVTLTGSFVGSNLVFIPNSPISIGAGQVLAINGPQRTGSANLRTTDTGITQYKLSGVPTGGLDSYSTSVNKGFAFQYLMGYINPNGPAGCPGVPSCLWSNATTPAICVSGIPTQCSDYFQDVYGCQNNYLQQTVACYVNPKTQVCTSGCSNFTAIQCLNVTGCHNNYTPSSGNTVTCLGSVSTRACETYHTPGTCTAAQIGCFWDAYIGYCFDSLNEVSQLYNCSFWNSLSSPNLACTFHGCSFTTAGQCVISSSINRTQDASITINYSDLVQFQNVQMLPNSLQFYAEIWQPLNIALNNPLNVIMGIGVPSSTSLQSVFRSPSVCTTLPYIASAPPTQIVYPAGSVSLTNDFITFVRTYQNFTFNQNLANQSAMYQFFGNVSIGPSSIIKSVSISNDNQYIIYVLQADLNWLYSNCQGNGITYSLATNGLAQFWNIPLIFMDRSSTNAWVATSASYQVNQNLNGAITLGSSAYIQTLVGLKSVSAVFDSTCPLVSQKRLQATFSLEYLNVYDTAIQVGPLSNSDIFATSNNCYGDQGYQISNLGYNSASATWNYQITTLSRCVNLHMNGTGFLSCVNIPDSYRLADLGSLSNFYPLSENSIHRFIVQGWTCPINRANNAACTLLHPTPADVPDTVTAMIQLNAYPSEFVSTPAIQVDYAILGSPTQVLDNLLQSNYFGGETFVGALTNNLPAWYNLSQIFRPTFDAFENIYITIQLDNTNLRSAYSLEFDTRNMTVYPADSQGNIMNTLPAFFYSEILSSVLYAPKMACAGSGCGSAPSATCVNPTTGMTYQGCDVMVLVGQSLLTLWNPSPQAVIFNLHYIMNTGSTSQVSFGSRRLLSSSSSSSVSQTFYNQQYIFFAANWMNGTGDAEGSSSSKSLSSAAIAGIAVGGGVLLLCAIGLVYYFGAKKHHRDERHPRSRRQARV